MQQKSKFSFTNWSVLEKKYAIVVFLLVTVTLNNFFCPKFALTKTPTQNSPLVCVAFVEKQEENKPRDDHIIIIMVKTKVKNRLFYVVIVFVIE